MTQVSSAEPPPVRAAAMPHPARLAVVGAVVLSVAAAFAYAAGWLSPARVTPARFIDTFEQLNGVHAGFRRNHAKGVGVSGFFEANGQGVRLSKAAVFRSGKVPVLGRFALGGGLPHAPDALPVVRSMALQFALPDGEEWRAGMNNIPVFPVSSPIAFREQLIALAPDKNTGKPVPAKASAFFASHPDTARAIKQIKAQAPTSGFGDSRYNSLNAFLFVDAAGHRTPVRWSMLPLQPTAASAAPTPQTPNALFDALIAQARPHPLRWRLVVTVGQPTDSTRDATVAWPPDREQVDVGTLTLDHVESEATSPVRTINFDPLVLPSGIEGSDDPLLSTRSATYSQSFTRRSGEDVSPSAVTATEVAR
jgi:catalase